MAKPIGLTDELVIKLQVLSKKSDFQLKKRFSSCFQWNYFELVCFIILHEINLDA
jgi:hypothetical protein